MVKIQRKSSQPFYEQIKEGLRREIDTGRYKPGDAIPDERVLAAQLGISRMTVRRAIVELSREGLLERVSGRGTFLRKSFTPQQKLEKGVVAILVDSDPLEPMGLVFYRLLQGINLGSESLGMPLVFRKITRPYEAFVASLRDDPALKGLIAIWSDAQPLLKLLAKFRAPTVLLDSLQPEDALPLDSVCQDGLAGVQAAMRHLLLMGHREIGFMAGLQDSAITAQRQIAYEHALAAHGVPFREELVYKVPLSGEAAYAKTQQILNGPAVPTAMVCSLDTMAVGVLAAIVEQGLRIPRDMSVIGYGDDGIFTVPQLSTVRVPFEQMGLSAMRLLVDRIARPSAPVQNLSIPAEWISRATCAAPRVGTLPLRAGGD